jgi:riboflavin synthase
MFTGIVTHVGEVAAVRGIAGGRELVVASGLPLAEIALGASVAHSGTCLTVVAKDAATHTVQASAETLARTTLGRWREGHRLNLERSLRLGDELGGHLVFGHVDAVGEITRVEPDGECRRVEILVPPSLAPLLAVKGSIAVDGISLTVNEAGADRFAVSVIPHTLAHTTLADRRVGDAVNLEADMLARYVARQLAAAAAAAAAAKQA